MTASSTPRAALCQECAIHLYGEDKIERMIAMRELSWKSQRKEPYPPQQLSILQPEEESIFKELRTQ